MVKLGDIAKLIRSKNAGALWLTVDIMFDDEENYRRVIDSDAITPESFAEIYKVTLNDIIFVHHDAALAIKISIPRPIFQGEPEDADLCGGQQYGPLVDIEVP